MLGRARIFACSEQSPPKKRKNTEPDNEGRKKTCTKPRSPPAYYSSFYTTARIWGEQGVTVLPGVCLDTGAQGQNDTISPDAVRAARLTTYPIRPQYSTGVNGVKILYKEAVTFDLTLAGMTRTLEAVVDHRHSTYSILLGMPGLHAFGISIDTLPVPPTATARRSLTSDPIPIVLDDNPGRVTLAVHVALDERTLPIYINEMILDHAFAEGCLPVQAYRNLLGHCEDLKSHFERYTSIWLTKGSAAIAWARRYFVRHGPADGEVRTVKGELFRAIVRAMGMTIGKGSSQESAILSSD